MKSSLVIALFVLAPILSMAQKPYIKFGNVSMAEMRMSKYEKDTAAGAVILYDHGSFRKIDYKFSRHVRIKVLTPAGAQFANFTIRAPNKSFIKGVTFNLEGERLVETKLESENIHTERITEGVEVYKVFLPNVKPGTVIDIEYSFNGLPFQWLFQNVIPVVYSELILEPTEYFYYKQVFYGLEKIKAIKEGHWVAENVPALRTEEYMSHYTNYLTRFEIDLLEVKIPNWGVYSEFSTSWPKVGERLVDHDYFGGVMRNCSFLNEKGNELEKSALTTNEKINEAYKYIQSNIKWNNQSSAIASVGYRENFNRDHSGNSAEVNLLLTSLLKKAGLNAYPVVLSTRENGLLNPLSASISKLNYVVAYVMEKDKTWLLDATSTETVPGILPERCLNTNGWIVDRETTGWVDLLQGKAEVKRKFVRIYSESADMLTAEVSTTYEDYGYLNWREEYKKDGSAEYGKNLGASEDLEIEHYTVRSEDKEKLKASDVARVNLTGSKYLQDIGREWLLNPFVLSEMGSNPFKPEKRKYPVDMIYPRNYLTTVSITLPQGSEVTSLPKSIKVTAPENSAEFSAAFQSVGNTISIRCVFHVRKITYSEEEYPIIHNFFSEVIRLMNQPIQVLKKT